MKKKLRNIALLSLTVFFNSGLSAQNDSILPDVYAEYNYYAASLPYDNRDTIYFKAQDPVSDTINVEISNGDTVAYIWLDGMQAYTKKGPSYNDSWLNNYATLPDTFEILYDFDLQPGDTAYCNEVVLERDTIQIQGVNRIRLKISELTWGDIWIQGIGSLEFIFRRFTPYCGNDFSNYLCSGYFESSGVSGIDTLSYECIEPYGYLSNVLCNECEYGNIDKQKKKSIKVFPNPLHSGQVNIDNPEKEYINKVTLYHLTGEQAFNEVVDSYDDKISFTIHGLSAGLYLLKIDTGENIIIRKIQYIND